MMTTSLTQGSMASASKTRSQAPAAVTTAPRLAILSRSTLARPAVRELRSRRVSTQATAGSEDVDFDKVLSDLADKFEASNNKAAIVGYSAAAIAALWFSEWLIHLPLLNFLLGFPIQLLGLALLPYFGVKYFVEKDSIKGDAGDAFNKVVKRLPGLEK